MIRTKGEWKGEIGIGFQSKKVEKILVIEIRKLDVMAFGVYLYSF